ncbi:MAG: hypothetical protein IPI96_14610 [Saprospiraceae bacterium]|nr:hypothetical protein [Saprospiraceae bacterium]
MPIILRWNYTDGTYQDERLDVQIWRKTNIKLVKTLHSEQGGKIHTIRSFQRNCRYQYNQ